VSVDITKRRETLRALLDFAIEAVDPERLTSENLPDWEGGTVTVIAIGKAGPAMCRGASRRLGSVRGICVSNTPEEVPDGIELVIGDHPVPGPASFAAGAKVLECAAGAEGDLVALISGGGSALCEHPIEGVDPEFVSSVNRRLLEQGASIADTNLVRRHLSAVKNGGVTRAANRPVVTYAISDVCGGDPTLIASGPTVAVPPEPDAAIEIMARHAIDVPKDVREAMHAPLPAVDDSPITVIADGHTAAEGVARAATAQGLAVTVTDGWLQGSVSAALKSLFDTAGPEITVAAGESEVRVTGDGAGGRNTHAALLTAQAIAGTDAVFAAFATDGVDGNSSSAGAIVDGTTVERGGDPEPALEASDSATYLMATGDLLQTGPTGTNVSDLWVLWR
jgi:glycerate 2-kinase